MNIKSNPKTKPKARSKPKVEAEIIRPQKVDDTNCDEKSFTITEEDYSDTIVPVARRTRSSVPKTPPRRPTKRSTPRFRNAPSAKEKKPVQTPKLKKKVETKKKAKISNTKQEIPVDQKLVQCIKASHRYTRSFVQRQKATLKFFDQDMMKEENEQKNMEVDKKSVKAEKKDTEEVDSDSSSPVKEPQPGSVRKIGKKQGTLG